MSLRMLINATRTEEIRAAILRDDVLEVLEIDAARSNLIKGSVYKGKVANVEGSLNACFIEIGTDRQGFLPRNDIVSDAFHEKPRKEGRPRIEEVIKRGRDIVVQVTRDAVGSKGPALTTQISLAGRYLVLMPRDNSRGISRKIEDDKQRQQLKDLAGKLTIPDGMGFIIRTAGEQVNKTVLNRDLNSLVKLWKKIEKEARSTRSPAVLHREGDLVERIVRDYYTSEFDELIVDTEEALERVQAYFRAVMPRTKAKITLHKDRTPLFTRFKLEEQIETIHARRVRLPSGGTIVIDPTEALISIDVNSGKATKARSQEETALKINVEAATEIARQLRLRDLGGLVVVDFIDMASKGHNRQVERTVKQAVKPDKARVYLGKISDNGLMEINRQRIKQSLQLRTHRECPTCSGAGAIPSPEFVAMQIIRRIDARASAGNLGEVHVDLHPELADFLQNNFRTDLAELEESAEIRILVSGRPGLHRNEQNLQFKHRTGGKQGGGRGRSRGRGDDREGGAGKRSEPTASKAAKAAKAGKGQKDAQKKPARGEENAQKKTGKGQKEAPQNGRKGDSEAKNKASKGGDEGQKKSSRGRGGRKPASADPANAAVAKAPAKAPAPAPRPADEDGDGGAPMTKSQKRRQRRKRKAERERMAAQGGEQPLDSGAIERTEVPSAPSVIQLLREMEAAQSEAAPAPTGPGGDETPPESPPRTEVEVDAGDSAGREEDKATDDKPSLVLTEPAPTETTKPRRSRGSRGRGRGRGSRGRSRTPDTGQLDLVDPPAPEPPLETGDPAPDADEPPQGADEPPPIPEDPDPIE